jgi:hypothetical protein
MMKSEQTRWSAWGFKVLHPPGRPPTHISRTCRHFPTDVL